MPPGPQVIDGGVNEPAPVPPPSPIHGSYHWSFERLVSIGLIPLTIAPFAAGSISPAIDASLVFLLIIHSHMGFQSCITDYFSVRKHPGLRKFFDWTLNIATLLVMWGFYEFETNDVGLTQMIKRVWHAGHNDATVGKADLSGLGHDGKLKHLTN
ncbi:Succinate dehydrogenase [ubiquinone] cytochrome b small subunit, mitochondrial [Cyphellophora attinorum]|uniref:Succinate dehydrogenase [ubiquinone] cytochrome b small subunit n=1 Tax=Cyphellophora attinorum TaxID=1664694 RepID=A0A0N1P222_9EURO|nr:Succinate dehydrogenase [ubiquinone] cytochrome b small subunit, mitochondrial [Phialophora attinorum]KPI44536.1 Succinate dehydrogenase [ubiquinone] cytochrome b small subunit, mitochondrial [Phialophora attinorum]